MKFLIKFPTRSRPEKFFSVLERYRDLFSSKNDYLFLISCDEDDESMNNEKIIDRLNKFNNLNYFFSPRKTKIDAINRDIDKINYDWDILISAADDMIPVTKDYDLIIQNHMNEYFPNLDGCLWYFDGHRKDINTQSIIGRKYFDNIKYIYHPSYKTYWCDNEHTEYSLSINKLKFIDFLLIDHVHPAWNGFQTWDKLYAENDNKQYGYEDEMNYKKRKLLNFPIEA